jgi:DNA-binding YbaB/EbfC family protein
MEPERHPTGQGGGQLDMQRLVAAAAQVQSQLMHAQQQLSKTEVEGSAGGGLVKVTINGQGELTDVSIATEVIEAEDPAETVATIADLMLAACRDAYANLSDIQTEAMGPLAPLAGGPGDAGPSGAIPGLPSIPGLPDLSSLFGQLGAAGGTGTSHPDLPDEPAGQ